MRRPKSTLRGAIPAVLVLLLCLALYVPRRAPTISTRFGGGDGGELVAVALSGGVAHPGGYPGYLLLARLLLLLPGGEPAARVALLSSLAAALAAALTTALLLRHEDARARSLVVSAAPGVFAGLSLALGARFWSQALIVEVYALHLCWLALCALLIMRWIDGGVTGWLLGAALALGFGMGTHLTLLMALPAALLAWWVAPHRPRLSSPLALGVVALGSVGLAVYGLLPLWDRRDAIPSWGATGSLAGWWAHVSGAEYRYLVGVVPWSERLSRVSFAVRDLVRQPGPLAVALALVWGWNGGWTARRPLTAFAAAVALIGLGFAVSYGAADGEVYLLPWTWAWCVAAGLGLERVIIGARSLPATWARLAPTLIALAVFGALLFQLMANARELNLRGDIAERERIASVLKAAPPSALLATSRDADTFGAWYVQRALGRRPDVQVIETRLLDRPWYRRQLARQLGLDDHQSLCAALMAERRPTLVFGLTEPRTAELWAASAACNVVEP